ncbi:L-arabinose transporter permease protein [Salmonella enterica subsp. indica serovar 6,14,25:z10:1,(2),7 str. 1121]|uniref:L-arabinose transporter permease protein n=1 Tax=Salmonella enterica subsp. indica serovar 6,14,25:z10:1,(2),7 str. 1121 TaxID=1173950 RepID=V1GU76_SALER|nr:L-arabinose transporter permease protein [Salmonella enterica subsp. indica serovar 6,14,25:z10:1,(2),7 str. 1121]
MWNAILPGVDGVIILASRMTSGQPMNSLGYELIVISACVSGAFP